MRVLPFVLFVGLSCSLMAQPFSGFRVSGPTGVVYDYGSIRYPARGMPAPRVLLNQFSAAPIPLISTGRFTVVLPEQVTLSELYEQTYYFYILNSTKPGIPLLHVLIPPLSERERSLMGPATASPLSSVQTGVWQNVPVEYRNVPLVIGVGTADKPASTFRQQFIIP